MAIFIRDSEGNDQKRSYSFNQRSTDSSIESFDLTTLKFSRSRRRRSASSISDLALSLLSGLDIRLTCVIIPSAPMKSDAEVSLGPAKKAPQQTITRNRLNFFVDAISNNLFIICLQLDLSVTCRSVE